MTERLGGAPLGAARLSSAAGGLLPSNTQNVIQTLGPSYNVGPFQGVDPADLIILVQHFEGLAAAPYLTFHSTLSGTGTGSAGTDYSVPAGKQLIIGVIAMASSVATQSIVIGYGNNGVAEGVTAPTNAVGLNGQRTFMAVATNTTYQWTVTLKVPAGKFPYAHAPGAGLFCGLHLTCMLRNT